MVDAVDSRGGFALARTEAGGRSLDRSSQYTMPTVAFTARAKDLDLTIARDDYS